MTTYDVNPRLRAAIKLRHMVDAISENWQQMIGVSDQVQKMLDDATSFMNAYGTEIAKNTFGENISMTNKNIEGVRQLLKEVLEALRDNQPIDLKINWNSFQTFLESVEQDFSAYERLPENGFMEGNYEDWANIWKVLKSNLLVIRGLSEAAYLRAKMVVEFSNEELDSLTQSIIKHIPRGFSLVEADKYEKEYIEAMDMIEVESNKKDNLWDRLLNLLAGAIPFKQTPAERVMMQRWLDGEKGELL
ncbi:MAG: hypothetical protein IPL46_02365 [Saprospiraceae bacterium]|nr:hypothetical protein [Saprospiraceae bacterium]